MNMEQISGTQDLGNKADNIIAVIREYDPLKILEGINGRIAVLKNRYYPENPIAEVHYELETGLLLEIEPQAKELIGYNFTWSRYLKDSSSYDWTETSDVVNPWDKEDVAKNV